MSGDDGKLEADAQALAEITKGLNDAIGELKKLGMIGEADTGRGFEDIALTGLETGHDGLTSDLKNFCDRWEWGVRSLIQDGNEFAKRVGLSAGMYHEQDQYIKGVLKDGVAAFGADPTLTDEQVEKMSMSEIADHGNFEHIDYSGKSFSRAFDHMKETDKNLLIDTIKANGLDPNTNKFEYMLKPPPAQQQGDAQGQGER